MLFILGESVAGQWDPATLAFGYQIFTKRFVHVMIKDWLEELGFVLCVPIKILYFVLLREYVCKYMQHIARSQCDMLKK